MVFGTQSFHTMFTSFLESLHTKGKKCVHYIPCSPHTWSHFIFGVTSYSESLHTLSHFILWVTSYEITSYQTISYQVHFILSTSYGVMKYTVEIEKYTVFRALNIRSYSLTLILTLIQTLTLIPIPNP